MQAHPLSTTAARIPSSLSLSPQTFRPAANLQLAPALLPGTRAAPHLGRPVARPAAAMPYRPVAEHSGLAHDAGNLLGALHLYCDLLNAPGVLRPEHRHYLADLHLIAARSSALIQRLLSGAAEHADATLLSQPDTSEASTFETEANRPACCADALRALAPVLERIAAGTARVTVAVACGLPAVGVPAEAMERITVNLVRNAVEAIRVSRQSAGDAELPGHIRVSLEAVGGTVRLTVEDDGPGMPPEVAAAFLRPGPLPPGAVRGLGHRIVHELAAETGAKLSVRMRPGCGTVFCLRWPIGEDAIELEPLHRIVSSMAGGLTAC